MSLGQLGAAEAIDPLIRMLAENDDHDPMLRHAGVMGLAGANSMPDLERHFKHESTAVRKAIIVALRKTRNSAVTHFLTDRDPLVSLEAARAIHDVPLTDAFPALAECISKAMDDDALWRRVLNANFRLGQPQHARALAHVAAREGPMQMRLEALELLAPSLAA